MWLKPSGVGGKGEGRCLERGPSLHQNHLELLQKKNLKFIPVLRRSSGALQGAVEGGNSICTNMREQKIFIKITISKQFICMGQLLVSQEKERTGYSANWLLLAKDFLQIHLNTPSIIPLSVEYLLCLLAFQVVEF